MSQEDRLLEILDGHWENFLIRAYRENLVNTIKSQVLKDVGEWLDARFDVSDTGRHFYHIFNDDVEALKRGEMPRGK